MYTHCIFCSADLGRNEVIEHFPVGRRLAFDAARGRLWAVCRRCERWNLTPIESRWEAIEEGERLFRDTRRRVSTENVGLARLPEGLELVRIGEPLRPELAAWRYGDQFGRRRTRNAITIGGAALAGGAVAVGLPLIGGAAFAMAVANVGFSAASITLASKGRIVLPHPEGGRFMLAGQQLMEVRLVPRPADDRYGWALELPHGPVFTDDMPVLRRFWAKHSNVAFGRVTLHGLDAERAAARLLPRINRSGGSRRRVQDAVTMLEEVGDPSRFWASAASRTREWGALQYFGDTGAIRFLPPPVRLALEMAANEDTERAAIEYGELAQLEAAWRDAEEVAAISDRLLVPEGVKEKLAELKRRKGPDPAE